MAVTASSAAPARTARTAVAAKAIRPLRIGFQRPEADEPGIQGRPSHGAGDRALPSLDVCSVCLRVHHGGTWNEAGEFIRAMRTWELAIVPRFTEVLCSFCTRAPGARGDRAPLPAMAA